MENNYKTEIIVQGTNGTTTTIQSFASKKDIQEALMTTNGYNSMVFLGGDEDQTVIINTNNVCMVSVRDLHQ